MRRRRGVRGESRLVWGAEERMGGKASKEVGDEQQEKGDFLEGRER